MENKAIIIGIGGVSCSGKSMFAEELSLHFRNSGYTAIAINQDDYVYPVAGIPVVKGHTDWECPESIDFESFGEAIRDASLCYDVVIAGGLMVFREPSVYDMFDFRIFIELTRSEFKRRKRKDLRWGREPEWYIDHIWDSYLKYGQYPRGLKPDLLLDGDEAFDFGQITNIIISEIND